MQIVRDILRRMRKDRKGCLIDRKKVRHTEKFEHRDSQTGRQTDKQKRTFNRQMKTQRLTARHWHTHKDRQTD